MELIKNRMLLFALRQVFGRIVKGIQGDQLERIERSNDGLGIVFRLSHLELNDVFINSQFFGGSQDGCSSITPETSFFNSLRFAHGYINSICGDFAFSPKGRRKVEIDGLQLVFDVIPKMECTMPTGPCHRRASGQRGRQKCTENIGLATEVESTDAMDDAMYSSLFMSDSLRKSVEETVVLPAIQETRFFDGWPSSQRGMIDKGLQVFEKGIKQFAHSICGCIRDVSIIFRIPPLGQCIVPGQEPPDGSLEVLVLFKGGFELENMSLDTVKDIYRRIRFSSPHVAIYKYGERRTTRLTDEEVEESVDLADVFLSGGCEAEFDNDVIVQFSEERKAVQGPEALIDLKVTTRFIFLILSPKQLGRLLHVARAFVGAPNSDNESEVEAAVTATSAPRAVRLVTTIRATCKHVSCTILRSEDQQGTKEFWQMLQQQSDKGKCYGTASPLPFQYQLASNRLSFRTGFYNVCVNGIMILLEPFVAGANSSDDALYDVFENYGGRGCSIGISSIKIYEGYPKNCENGCTGVSETGRLILTTKENSEDSSERCYRIAFVARTTYPLTLEEARGCCVNLPEGCQRAAAIVVQHVLVTTAGAVVLVELDGSVIGRLVTLWAELLHIVNTVFATNDLQRQEQWHDGGGGEHAGEGFVSLFSSSVAARQVLEEESASCERSAGEGKKDCHSIAWQLSEGVCVESFVEKVVTTPYVFLRFFTLQLEGVTLEMKYHALREPDPDYYGPLTRRLWKHLRDEGEVMSTTTEGNVMQSGVDGPYLPLSISVYLKLLDLSVGSAGILELFLSEGRLTLHDYNESVQSNIVYCVFDTKRREPNIAVSQRQFVGLQAGFDVAKKAHLPFGTEYKEEERLAEENSAITVVMKVKQVRVELHQDEFLLTLFYLDQLAEAVDKACFILSSYTPAVTSAFSGMESVNGVAIGSDSFMENRLHFFKDDVRCKSTDTDSIITTGVSIRLTVDEGTMTLWAPRLSSAGLSIGEPLWRCISRSERSTIDKSHLYHRYEVLVSKVSVFAFYQASSLIVETFLHAEASFFSLQERLCCPKIPYADFAWPANHSSIPKWGGLVTLLQSYTKLYNRANNIAISLPSKGVARDCQAVGVSLCRHRNVIDHTETYDVAMHFDRINVVHQAAHEGDHWLFVILNCFADANTEGLSSSGVVEEATLGSPILENEGESEEGEGNDVRSYDGVAVAISANINIVLIDTLFEYKPFGKYSMLVCLAPRLEIVVSVPSLQEEDTRVNICLLEKLSVFFHNSFQNYLLEYDRIAGFGSLFGSSERGLATDLKTLGYVLVLDIGHTVDKRKNVDDSEVEQGIHVEKNNGIPNITLHIKANAEKFLFVEVQNLNASMFFAHDSLYYFRLLVSHFLSGMDLFYLPPPYLFVQKSGEHFAHIIKAESIKKETTVAVLLVSDYESYLSQLLNTSVFDIDTVSLGSKEEIDQVTNMRGVASTSSLSDFLLIEETGIVLEKPVRWIIHGEQSINLDMCCAYTNFLSVYNSPRLGAPQCGWKTGMSFGHALNTKLALRALPSGGLLAMKFYLHGCDATINLYGGDDFNLTGVPQSYLYSIHRYENNEEDESESFLMWSGMDSDVDFARGHREGQSSGILGGGRRQSEHIIACFTGIRLQIDLFAPGRSEFMQVYLAVQDGKVLDCIEKSPVSTLLMPFSQSLRDHDSDLFEIKWTTILPRMTTKNAGKVSVGKPEEQLVVRLQPITVALHRHAMDLLPQFFEIPEGIKDENDVWNARQHQSLFFSKIIVHPFKVTLYIYFEGHDILKATKGDMFELCNFILPSIEQASIDVPLMVVTACPLDLVGEKIGNILRGQVMKLCGLFKLLCGIQPLNLASNVGVAGTNLFFAPISEYRRHKRFFSALSHALYYFLTTLVSQSLHCAVTTTQRTHDMTSSMTKSLMSSADLPVILRGSQPVGMFEGFSRGFHDFIQGFYMASNMYTYCLGPRGNLVCLPLAASAVIDGILRGMYDVTCGMRNAVTPEIYERERKLFKGSKRKK